uniref:Terpene synthase N-terminal domain-containing protein n=1 Tax=Cannabis sativa TaxID=3483 RepID=A0A803R1P0_CANSA
MHCITLTHQISPLLPNICSTTNFGVFFRPKVYTNYNIINNNATKSRLSSACYPIQCAVVNSSNAIIDRRSANFEPSIWSFDYIQSLTSQYKGEPYTSRVKKLERDVKKMLVEMENSLAQLELIDTLQRLGISYRFENEINSILNKKYVNINNPNYNLYAIALQFRLLRQHGYAVPQGIYTYCIHYGGVW